jgi:hypothetical protein
VKAFCSVCVSVIAIITPALAAEQNWTGEFSDKNFLNGKAVFQLSIEQSGKTIQVAFDAVYNDGHGAAPEGSGTAKSSGKDGLEFRWQDNFRNGGTGRITRAGDDLIVSIKATRVGDTRCLDFYRENIRLKRAKR